MPVETIESFRNWRDIGHSNYKQEVLSIFETFKVEIINLYGNGSQIMQNPTYVTRQADNEFGVGGRYEKSIDLLHQAILYTILQHVITWHTHISNEMIKET